jgi:hypothetical protein
MSSNTQPITTERVRKTPANILLSQKKYTAKRRQDPEYIAYHHKKAVEWRIRKYAEDEQFREKAKEYTLVNTKERRKKRR